MFFANAGGGSGGVELSERLLRLAKRGLWMICPLYACVKGRSEALGNLTARAVCGLRPDAVSETFFTRF